MRNVKSLEQCVQPDATRVFRRIVELSTQNRTARQGPLLFGLAYCWVHGNVKDLIQEVFPSVVRIGTHLFQFVDFVQTIHPGWNRSLRRLISSWYDRDVDKLAYQILKYQSREGWAHTDLLKLAHSKTIDPSIAGWILGKDTNELPHLLAGYEQIKQSTKLSEVVDLIHTHRFTHEMVPSQWKGETPVWEALFQYMPITALLRNLGQLTARGVLAPLASGTVGLAERFSRANLIKGRIHPLSVLQAVSVYDQGHGVKGCLSWTPVPQVVGILDKAFTQAFDAIESTGKRWLLGIDVSGSMTWVNVSGMAPITPAIGAACMAMATARSEANHHILGFSHTFKDLGILPTDSLQAVVKKTQNQSVGQTDCSLPMVWASRNRVPVDIFVVYTDNETNTGSIHPAAALKEYRQRTGIDARLAVVAMTAGNFSIADPADKGMLDVVGFDSATPQLLSQFAGGLV